MPDDIAVFQVTSDDAKCDECGAELLRGRMLRKEGDKGLCLDCADLGHLSFLGSGNACVTRRARKYSPIAVVVLRWSRARKHYERQGLLLTGDAIDRAEEECFDDADLRERRRLTAAMHRNGLDAAYVAQFAAHIRQRFPDAPAGVETAIAEHACRKHSRRIGRTAAAKDFDPEAIDLAVRAHIRHQHTRYDELLSRGSDREFARASVRGEVESVLGDAGGRREGVAALVRSSLRRRTKTEGVASARLPCGAGGLARGFVANSAILQADVECGSEANA